MKILKNKVFGTRRHKSSVQEALLPCIPKKSKISFRKIICLITVMLLFLSLPVSAKTVRVLYGPDGGVSVVHPAPNSQGAAEIEGQWLQRVFDKATPEGLDYDDLDSSELPSREKRSAWRGNKEDGLFVDEQAFIDSQEEKRRKALIKEEIEKMAVARLDGRDVGSSGIVGIGNGEMEVLKSENAQLRDRLAAIEGILGINDITKVVDDSSADNKTNHKILEQEETQTQGFTITGATIGVASQSSGLWGWLKTLF